MAESVDDDHVDVRGHLVNDVNGLRVGEVQGQAALAAVQRHVVLGLVGHEPMRVSPGFALNGLHLDDVRAHVGQQHSSERPGDDLGELEYLDSGQRSGHVGTSSHFYGTCPSLAGGASLRLILEVVHNFRGGRD